jgi:ACS family hexuronate transporter-like MFS transporter
MFPRSAVGSMTGIGGMAGAVGGALLAYYAGHILQRTHSYSSLFFIAGAAYLTAWVVLQIFAPGLREVEGLA